MVARLRAPRVVPHHCERPSRGCRVDGLLTASRTAVPRRATALSGVAYLVTGGTSAIPARLSFV